MTQGSDREELPSAKDLCSTCSFRQELPGNTHISCGYMNGHTKPSNVIAGIGAKEVTLSQYCEASAKAAGYTIEKHGLDSGWCYFPFNYDPVWLKGVCEHYQYCIPRFGSFDGLQ